MLSSSYPQIIFVSSIQGTPLGKDCYKIKFAITSKQKGKSGGARIITCVKLVKSKIYLMAIYDKSEKENISEQDLDRLLMIIAEAL